jgi:hypothetical protein
MDFAAIRINHPADDRHSASDGVLADAHGRVGNVAVQAPTVDRLGTVQRVARTGIRPHLERIGDHC